MKYKYKFVTVYTGSDDPSDYDAVVELGNDGYKVVGSHYGNGSWKLVLMKETILGDRSRSEYLESLH